jgi:cyclophilin family peptidyl-prolyl cis-trans isomerase/HEAT repeat protein
MTNPVAARTLLLCALVAAATGSCRHPEAASELDVTDDARPSSASLLDRAEDRRAFSDDLAALADSNDRDLRSRLAVALGRIGDPRSAPVLVRLLGDPDAAVREKAAFAIGLLGDRAGREAVDAIAAALDSSGDLVPPAAALDALGRTGGTGEVALVTARLRAPDAGSREDAARALGLLGQRGVSLDAGAVAALGTALSDGAEEVRFMAAFALFRGGFSASPDAAADPLRRAAASDPSPEVRAMSLRALAKGAALGDPELDAAAADPDDRVAATAMLAIANLPVERRCPAAARALVSVAARLEKDPKAPQGTYAHAARAALEQIAGCTALPELSRAAARIEAAVPAAAAGSEPTAGEARVRCLARLAAGRDALSLVACDPARPHVGKRMLIRRIAALEKAGDEDVSTLIALADEPDPRVAAPALEALAAIPSDRARAAVLAALADEHGLIVAAALDAISSAPDGFRPGALAVVDRLREVVDRFDPGDEGHAPLLSAVGTLGALADPSGAALLGRLVANLRPEVRAAATEALEKVPGATAPDVPPPLEPIRPTSHARRPDWIGREVVATVSTTRGSFTIALKPDVAPATVESFAELAARDFFDGTEIHRVVPNFVVQAGDPTGSGLGDAGYTLRCEVSATAYRRGTVGMALSGKDTGGSQFFVALSRQPHLDGHYTAFGEVVSGMEVLDLIEEGDEILDVEIEVKEPGTAGPTPQTP